MLISTIERLESVIKEVETEYDNAWRTTELDIRNSYSPQLSALNYAKPEIWESDDEFNQRIRTERTNINNERDRLITTRRREGEAEKAKQTESIRTQLQEALSILKRQTWTLKGSDVELIVGEYDRNAKIWPFTVVSRNSAVPVPSWPVIADFSRNSNLRDTLVKLDGAVKANALSAEIVWKIERKEENPSSYGGTKEIKYYVVLSQVAVRNIVDNSTVARDYVNKQIATFQPGRRNTTKSLFGSVKITTEGENAEIFIANRSIGTAPLNVNLLEGDYNVEAHWPNGWILSAPVSLSAGKSIVSRISKAPIRFVFVEGGTFQMGSINGNSDENPVHNVTVSSFLMSKYEVTQVEYKNLMGNNPSDTNKGIGWDYPVNKVRWNDAVEYCNKLSIKNGLTPVYSGSGNNIRMNINANGYRLPTEAEWVFSASGGNSSRGYTYSGSNTIGSVAWYSSNSGNKTHPGGGKKANELGLYDMSGNVWEWCWDWYGKYSSGSQSDPTGAASGSDRVYRGGCWSDYMYNCQLVSRGKSYQSRRDNGVGFRLVRRP